VAVAPEDAALLYVGCAGPLLRSTDAGASWTSLPFPSPDGPARLLPLPGRPGALVAVADAVYVSGDRGETWGRTLNDEVIELVAAGSGGSVRLLAGTREGLLGSDDLGRTWSPSGSGLPASQVGQLEWTLAAGGPGNETVYTSLREGVFASRDAGRTWLRAGDPPLAGPYTWMSIEALAVDPGDGRRVFAAGPLGVFRSNNVAASWEEVGSNSPQWQQVIVPRSGPWGGLVTAGEGVHRFVQAKGRWRFSARGIDRARVMSLAVVTGRSWRVLADTFGRGLVRSDDGGRSWVSVLLPEAGTPGGVLVADPSLPDVLYCFGERIWRTADGGVTWTVVADGPPTSSHVAVSPTDPRTFWVASGSGTPVVWRSRDEGATWKTVLVRTQDDVITALAPAPAEWRTVYVSLVHGGILRSEDGGETWKRAPAGLPDGCTDMVVDASDALGAWCVTGGGLVVTTRNGWDSWAPAGDGLEGDPVRRLLADGDDPLHLLAVTASGVFETLSGGAFWSRLGDLTHLEDARAAWDPRSGTVLLAPWGRSILAGTFGNEPLTAEIQAVPPPQGRTYRFTAHIRGGAVPYAVAWDFGDGSGPMAGNPVEHVFPGRGHFSVHVEVTGRLGAVARAEATVDVPVFPAPSPRRVVRVRPGHGAR